MRDYAELVKALREGAEWAEELCAHETAKRQSDAADAIEELLAKVPKQGEWEHQELAPTNWTFCSVCGRQRSKKYKWYYCPNCGARMKGAKDGTTDNA